MPLSIGILRLPSVIRTLKLPFSKMRFYISLRQTNDYRKIKWHPKPPALFSWRLGLRFCLERPLISPLAPCSQTLPLAPSSSFPSTPSSPPLFYQFRHTDYLAKLSLFSESLSTPFSSELVRTCRFKLKPSEEPQVKPLNSYISWTLVII